MNKILLIFRNEVITHVSRLSFWIGAVGIPLLAFAIYGVASFINARSVAENVLTNTITEIFSSPADKRPDGFVDPGDLVRSVPEQISPGILLEFSDEASARQALEGEVIRGYYLISPYYLQDGEIIYTRADFNPVTAFDDARRMEWVLEVNLLEGDVTKANRLRQPFQIETIQLTEEPVRDQDNPMTFFLPYGVTLLFYVMIMSTSSLMLSSVNKEKENCVIELLMVTVNPRQLLSGKMIALGLIGIFQMVLWAGSAFILLRLSGRTFNLPVEFQLPPTILFWGLIYFILGYLIYASLMAGLGALVPNLREASQATFVIVLPMIIPLFLISVLIRDPNGVLAVILSLFPLTSSITMLLRLAATIVPLWQILLSILLLVLMTLLIIRAVAGMFRAQTLLSGQSFNVKLFLQALFGRA